MSTPNEDWYGHLVAQSRNDNIYTLLEQDWSPNHDLDFVVVRKSQLPGKLKDVPAKHLSKNYCNLNIVFLQAITFCFTTIS